MTREAQRAAIAAYEATMALRRRRSELASDVMQGARLSAVIREHGTALRGVQIDRLVQWQPGVGSIRAGRILRGLPARSTLGDLDAPQSVLFLMRLVNYERKRHRS